MQLFKRAVASGERRALIAAGNDRRRRGLPEPSAQLGRELVDPAGLRRTDRRSSCPRARPRKKRRPSCGGPRSSFAQATRAKKRKVLLGKMWRFSGRVFRGSDFEECWALVPVVAACAAGGIAVAGDPATMNRSRMTCAVAAGPRLTRRSHSATSRREMSLREPATRGGRFFRAAQARPCRRRCVFRGAPGLGRRGRRRARVVVGSSFQPSKLPAL